MSQQQQHERDDGSVLSLLSTWCDNFTTQTSKTFSELRTTDYIRLVTIIGAYLLLRPYLMKLGAHFQAKQHEADGRAGQDAPVKESKIAIPGVDSDSDSEDEDKDDWGRAARLRQRAFIRKTLEVHERRLREEAEASSDKDIEEFLVD